jgi:2-methylfumaryl-CoA isomerase
VEINRHERVKDGNYLYGAFGRDFRTRDGRRVMIVALTGRQWHSLVAATDLGDACASIEKMMDVDLSDEGGRFTARELIGATLRPWVLSRSIAEVREIFDVHGVCWGPYQTFTELVEQDPRCSLANPLFAEVEQPGIGIYRMPGSPLVFGEGERLMPKRAPTLGEHTEEVLADVLGLSDAEIGRLLSDGVVARATILT